MDEYHLKLNDTYLFLPEKGIHCINELRAMSKKGLMLLRMDKGFHNIDKIDNMEKPEIVNHGSFSLWVNFHALGSYCQKQGGKAIFTSHSTFHLQIGCFLFLENAENFHWTIAAYQRFVNDFGPDDYNSIKKLTYEHLASMSLIHLLAILRLSSYDSTMFLKIVPRLKEIAKNISYSDRERIVETLDMVWYYYFDINENKNVALIIAGIYFDLAFYERALVYYQHSKDIYGIEMDTFYNKILCFYQLRQDMLFSKGLEEARILFPRSDLVKKLDALDLSAV